MPTLTATAAGRILRAAVRRHFPRLALVVTFSRRDYELVDLLVRANPDVRIFWLDSAVDPDAALAGVDEIQSRWHVTPLRASSLRELAEDWDVEAILTSRASGAVYERDDRSGLLRINPIAALPAAGRRAASRWSPFGLKAVAR